MGDRLRGRIFDEVFPYLAEGFVHDRRSRFDEKTEAGDEFLGQAYDATLTLLYRLLFLLYAESLDLLPVHEPAYAAVSLTGLKQEAADAAGKDADAVNDQLKKRYTKSDTGLWQRLSKLFQAIAEGSREHNVPAYNGGLFSTAPDGNDQSREAQAGRFLKKYRVPDFFLARALDLLAREEDPKTRELVFVDYRSLGVRQLGTIYEGLLMYHVVVPRDDWERGFRRPNLRVALVPSNQQRKSTGSYFTPQHIVKYIVTNTVGPLLDEKFAAAAPKLREARRWFADKRKFEDKKAEKLRSRPPSRREIDRWMLDKFEPVVWELLDLKVLDPAMGSAHFLVETVDYITDRVLDFLAGFPTNPVQVVVDQRIRRQIHRGPGRAGGEDQRGTADRREPDQAAGHEALRVRRGLEPHGRRVGQGLALARQLYAGRAVVVPGPSPEVRQFAGRHDDRRLETRGPRLGLRHQDGAARAGDRGLGGGRQPDGRHAHRGQPVGRHLQEVAGRRARLPGACWTA